jgi:hypothetical protein
MRLHLLSDLHLELGEFTPPQPDAHVVLLPGDTHLGSPTPADYMAATWCQVDATGGTSVI